MNIRHVHSSSKYDRSAQSLTTAAKWYNERADIVTYTEVEKEFRESAIRKANGKNFGFVSGDESYANDCAISYRHSRFALLHSENYKSTNVPFFDKGGKQKHPQWATTAVLKDKTNGKVLVVTVIHLASGIEGDLRVGRKTKAVLNWFAAFHGAKRRANKLKRRFRADGILFVADFNINFKQLWARTLVNTQAPLYRLTWQNLNFKGGTHGGRVIDGSLIAGRIGVKRTAVLMKDDSSSDHRPYKEELSWL